MITLEGLSKTFRTADGTVEALKNVSLTVNDGDIYGIIGMSGAGKSTLVKLLMIHIIRGVDYPVLLW
jgi:D-methionine transport system ATP-binding protein